MFENEGRFEEEGIEEDRLEEERIEKETKKILLEKEKERKKEKFTVKFSQEEIYDLEEAIGSYLSYVNTTSKFDFDEKIIIHKRLKKLFFKIFEYNPKDWRKYQD
tara:strand:+ start:2294 stop:2608 length:315 start_codon:yes stop_codon:yes gene_type:complete